MKVEISTCPYNRWIKLIYINCSCIKIEGKAYSAWCIGMNKYEPTLQERVPDRTCGFGSIMFKLNMMIQNL